MNIYGFCQFIEREFFYGHADLTYKLSIVLVIKESVREKWKGI